MELPERKEAWVMEDPRMRWALLDLTLTNEAELLGM